jgi:hypothetical protein
MTAMRHKTFNHRPQLSLSGFGEARTLRPVTLPKLNFIKLDIEHEAKEAAERFATTRIIRQGRDAWEAINKTQSFDGWLAIGKALLIGREFALRATGANAPMGRRYCLAFSQWSNGHGFTMQKSVRSVAVELAEHSSEITRWRDSLPERQRRRLIHPLSVTRRWKAATGQYQALRSRDLKWEAQYAWRRFVCCVKALPADQATALWQIAHAEAQLAIGP